MTLDENLGDLVRHAADFASPDRVHVHRPRARCRRRDRLRVHLSSGRRRVRCPLPLLGPRGRRAAGQGAPRRRRRVAGGRLAVRARGLRWQGGGGCHGLRPRTPASTRISTPCRDWQQEICRQVRDLVHAADPRSRRRSSARVQPYFVLDGNICALLAAKDHVTSSSTTARSSPIRRASSRPATTTRPPARWPSAGASRSTSRPAARCSARSSPTTGPAAGARSRAADPGEKQATPIDPGRPQWPSPSQPDSGNDAPRSGARRGTGVAHRRPRIAHATKMFGMVWSLMPWGQSSIVCFWSRRSRPPSLLAGFVGCDRFRSASAAP